ncbi:probable membrane protein STY4873, partial [hydrothermal vent metagenome]
MTPLSSKTGSTVADSANSGIALRLSINGNNAGRDMKIFATAMLVVMAIIYFASKSYEHVHPALGFVRAFAEAAMVGGLADWFAVTALFRHPMGIPIPHTAIIPRNKDRIGDTLANFLKDNFLVSKIVAQRMHGVDMAGAVGRFLKSPSGGQGRMRMGASRLLSDVIGSLDKDRLGKMFKSSVKVQAKKLDLATPLGQILDAVMAENRHGPLINSSIKWAYRSLDANENIIRTMVTERANAVLRWTGLDDRIANEVIDGLYKLLADMVADPAHPLRAKTEETLVQLADELKHDPDLRQRIEEWKLEMIENPAIANWIDGMWEHGREA